MPCLNCGSNGVLGKKAVSFIEGIKNKVFAIYCANCGNLRYGYCRPVK